MSIKKISLDQFADVNPEGVTKSYSHDQIEYIDISSVGSGYLVDSIRVIPLKEAPSRAKRIIRTGDTILSTVRPNLRSFLFVKDAKSNSIASTGFAVLRAKSNADPRFIYYAVTDSQFTGYLTNNTKGTSYPAVDSDTILRGEVPDFHLQEQKRIGKILSSYDDLIENNRRRIQLLEQSARLLYKEWFISLRFPGHEHVKITNGVPEGWERKTAFEVMNVLSGGTPKTDVPDYWNGEIPFFTPKDAIDSAYVFMTEKTITESGLKKCNSKLYPKDTVFITARGTVGNINLASKPMAMNQSCYALIANHPINQYYLYFALIEGVEQFRSRAVGAVFDAIIRDTFKMIPFLVPD